MTLPLEIIAYAPCFQLHFARLNKAWLQEHFVVTPLDEYELAHPQESISQLGGTILVTREGTDIIGVLALKTISAVSG
ncbi:hypothetical protein [Hymenobacter sp. BT730]|uniref:hypothetical protein n=1 Tax=Hymenobacter sp. BT730 TaxID=3063332 RepID=UPI0026DFDC99|nr:hypothetical protein [Hymenobacter sp. BT730]